MSPFGETVLAWRLSRAMTQADLARAARIPRPNLSAIERGDREVTLKTLRALALALDIRPGVLADGIAPAAGAPPLSRTRLERIARAAVGATQATDPREAALAGRLRQTLSTSIGSRRTSRPHRPAAGADRAYFLLKTQESPETVSSLIDRTRLELERR